MRAFFWGKRILDAVVNGIAVGLLVFLTVVIFVATAFRYFFNLPLAWSEEASRFAFIWVTLLGSAICVREGAHIGIDLLIATLPGQLSRLLKVVNGLVIGLIALALLVFGVELFPVARMTPSPAIGLPMTVMYAAMPVAGFLMFIEVLAAAFTTSPTQRSS